MRKQIKAWAVIDKKGNVYEGPAAERWQMEDCLACVGATICREHGLKIIPGTFTYDDGRGGKK